MFIVIYSFLEHTVEMMVPGETRMLYTWQGASITAAATHGKNLPRLLPVWIFVISLNYIELYIVLYKHVSNIWKST